MIAAFVRYKATVLIFGFCVLLFGIRAYSSLPRESFPDVKVPVVMVTTTYIGVSPEDIESLLTIPIENEVASITDIRKLSSSSVEGASIISIEFEPDVVIEDALQRVRDRVNRAKSSMPADAEEPEVREVSFSDMPILLVTIAGPQDLETLKSMGEAVGDRFERIEGVLDVNLSGGLERQFRVLIDPVRLAHYSLSLDDVSNALRNENTNIPGGDVRAGTSTFLLRVPGDFDAVGDLESVAIKRRGGRPVFLRDVARVVDGYADRTSYARMDREQAVSIAVTKRVGANILDIADEVKAISAEVSETWPNDVTYRVLADQSTQIRQMVSELENNIITALILVVVVLFFFMGARNSLFVALAIPLSMFTSFAVLQAFDITLNMVVLFSLILALGMLVDNAIVIVENIYRHAEEGLDITAASIIGTREVAIAVAASTATTVAAFFPMVFWDGIMGQFMGFLPKTVIIVLVSSLVVAVAILPVVTALAMRVISKTNTEAGGLENTWIMQAYRRLLVLSIEHRYISAGMGFASLILTFMAYGVLNHGTEFFPEVEPNRATISVRGPDGTDLEATDRVVRRIEGVLEQLENVDVSVAESGVGGNPMEGAQEVPNLARITVDFLPDANNVKPGEEVRMEPTWDTIGTLRDALQQIPGVLISVEKEETGPPVGAPIAVEVSGDDFHRVGELAAKVRRDLSGLPGVTELRDDYRVGRPEMRLRIDRGAAKRVGASTAEVAQTVRTAFAGNVATTIRDGEDEYDVVVEVDQRYASDLQSVLALRIPGREDTSPDTFSVPLSAVASYTMAGGSGTIRHIDQDLVVTIQGDVLTGFNENAVRASVAEYISKAEVPNGFSLRLGGADDEQRNAQAFLTNAFMIALALIAIVLVTQFNSVTTPAIIITSVLLSLVGVLWGLILTGTPFGIMMTGMGVISLAGVVVNNAIVLLDYVEQLKAKGTSTQDALVQAGMTRFRPVILTAITTILGLVPMATGISFDFTKLRLIVGGSGGAFWKPMAVSVIFGLLFATLLTLVMVPTLYSIVEDLKQRAGGIWRRRGGAAAAALLLVAVFPSQGAAITLEEALASGEANNLDVAMAQEATVQAETLRGQAWSQLQPQVNLNGAYVINEFEVAFDFADNLPATMAKTFPPSDPTVIQEKEFFQASASMSQPLLSGRALPLLRGAYASVDAAQHTEAWRRTQVRGAIADAFYQTALARESRALAEKSLAVAQDQMALAERQVTAGLAPRRAQLQAELGLRRAQREVAAAKAQQVSAEAIFARVTGLAPETPTDLGAPASVPATLDEALDTAQASRPDLMASQWQTRAARYQHQAGNLLWMPRVDGRFNYSWTENTGFTDEATQWQVLVEASWNLWDGGLRLAQAREDKSRVRSAEMRNQQILLEVEEGVRTAWERLEQANRGHEAATAEVAVAEENLMLATREVEAGSATWLELDEARLAHFGAGLAELRERTQRDLAAIALRVAMGDF